MSALALLAACGRSPLAASDGAAPCAVADPGCLVDDGALVPEPAGGDRQPNDGDRRPNDGDRRPNDGDRTPVDLPPTAGAPADVPPPEGTLPAEAWRIAFDELPSGPFGARIIDLVVGPGDDIWVLGELGNGLGSQVFVTRVAPDGERRWAEPWIGERPAGGLSVGPQPLPTGWLAVDADERAAVAASTINFLQTGTEHTAWITQLSPEGRPVWEDEVGGGYVAGLAADEEGRLYTALSALGEHNAPLLLSRHSEGLVDTVVAVQIGAVAPVMLVPAEDDTIFVAGMRAQIFGVDMEAFVERYGVDDGLPVWPPPPPARDVRDYTGAVAAANDTRGGVLAVIATDLPSPNGRDLNAGPGFRDVQRLDADGSLSWSTRLRTAGGEERQEGFADWEAHLAVDARGEIAVAYAVGSRFTGPLSGEPLRIFVERLDADGAFAWDAPYEVGSDDASLVRGLAFGGGGALYLVTAPDNPSVGGFNWLIRLDVD